MSKNDELEKVRQNLQAWLTAINAKSSEALFALYDEESIYANANAPLMRGVKEIKPWYEQAFQVVEGTLYHIEEAAFIEDNMALLLGAYYFSPPEGVTPAEEANLTGRVLLAYRKNSAGEWKLLFDIDNTPPDITPELFSGTYLNRSLRQD